MFLNVYNMRGIAETLLQQSVCCMPSDPRAVMFQNVAHKIHYTVVSIECKHHTHVYTQHVCRGRDVSHK